MTLEKLTIHYEKGKEGQYGGKLKALFNPSQLSFSKSVSWERVDAASTPKEGTYGSVQFKSSEPETLSVNLFFDTYADGAGSGPASLVPSTGPRSVLPYLDEVAALARLDRELHRPPMCELRWGKVLLFTGVLTSMSRQLLLFLEDGTPVRATMDCSFLECQGGGGATNELHSADVTKKYTVLPGDTLLRIAAELYNDQSLWRLIAEANGIDNPRLLAPGQVLSIPKIR
jgi:nucleoid-associated protein YgaU